MSAVPSIMQSSDPFHSRVQASLRAHSHWIRRCGENASSTLHLNGVVRPSCGGGGGGGGSGGGGSGGGGRRVLFKNAAAGPGLTLKQNQHFEKRNPTWSRCGGQSREPPIRPEDAHRKRNIVYHAALAL